MILQPSDFIISLSGNSMISQPGRANAQTREGKVQIIYGSKYNLYFWFCLAVNL